MEYWPQVGQVLGSNLGVALLGALIVSLVVGCTYATGMVDLARFDRTAGRFRHPWLGFGVRLGLAFLGVWLFFTWFVTAP